MAKGRFISKTIAVDKRLNELSLPSHFLFLMTIPHLDRDGLILYGNGPELWATVAPRRYDLLPQIHDLVDEWLQCGLAIVYDDPHHGQVLFLRGFGKNQGGLRYDREPESVYAPPPGWERTETGLQECTTPRPDNTGSALARSQSAPEILEMPDNSQGNAEELPEERRSNAGSAPADCRIDVGVVPEKLRPEVEDQEEDKDQEEDIAAAAIVRSNGHIRDGLSAEEVAAAAAAKRFGINSKLIPEIITNWRVRNKSPICVDDLEAWSAYIADQQRNGRQITFGVAVQELRSGNRAPENYYPKEEESDVFILA